VEDRAGHAGGFRILCRIDPEEELRQSHRRVALNPREELAQLLVVFDQAHHFQLCGPKPLSGAAEGLDRASHDRFEALERLLVRFSLGGQGALDLLAPVAY
jgi:hypothetical protein